MRTRFFKLLAAILALSIIVGMTACGTSNTQSSQTSKAETTNSSEGGTQEGDASTSTGEIKKVIMAMCTWTGAPADTQMIQDAINDITRESIGVEVQLQISDSGSYSQNMTLSLSGGETIDIMSTLIAGYATNVQQGHFRDLEENDLLSTYGQGIIDVMGQDNLDACRIGGVLYGLPNNRDFAQGRGCAAIATEYLEGIGYEFPDSSDEIVKISLDELNDIYARLHAQYPELEVYRPGTGSMSQFSNVDSLGGNAFGVLLDYGATLDVVNLFESDFYKDYCQRMYTYNQNGYISQDAATDTTAVTSLVQAGSLMSYTTGGKPGIKAQETSLCGRAMTIFQTLDDYISSTSIGGMPWVIPENSEEPEAAMTLLNAFYTDERLANILAWGVEGVHYKVQDNGLATYPDGVDANNSGWNHSMGWLMPNQFLSYVWEGNAPDLWEQISTFNTDAKRSAASGFTFDSANVATEVTAVQNVYDEFQKSLEYGFVDPSTGISEMNSKMESAGLLKIIEEKQNQLNEWAAAMN